MIYDTHTVPECPQSIRLTGPFQEHSEIFSAHNIRPEVIDTDCSQGKFMCNGRAFAHTDIFSHHSVLVSRTGTRILHLVDISPSKAPSCSVSL